MDGYLFGDSSSNHGIHESGGPSRASHESPSEEGPVAGRWYMSRKEIEENSPSRRDAIDLKKEAYLRKSYCTFLQDLGMRLKVPQVTIATAIIFCHRFFLRQSHAKNDRRTMATVCMFLAGKVEETPRPLKDVILVSYEIIHKKDPTASQRIKQKEVYEQQKELILLGEKLVLTTLAFDLNVNHPYKPLVEAIKKFKVAQNALAQVAWNFVNDGLRTSLCLQFKPHHIAAGAIFLASKFLKVKLPSDGDKVWWQEFDVTSRELEEVSNQMLELYEQNGVPPSQKSEAEGSAGGRAPTKTSAVDDEQVPGNGHAQAGLGAGSNAKSGTLKQFSSRPAPDHHGVPLKSTQNQNNDNGSTEMGSVITDHKIEGEIKENQHSEQLNVKEASKRSNLGIHRVGGEDEERNSGRIETTEAGEWRDNGTLHKPSSISSQNLESREGLVGQSPKDVIKKIDKDKVKAAIEKRKKSRTDMPRKKDVMDDDDLIERELEDGVELAAEDEKTKRERRQSWSKSENPHQRNDHDDLGDGNHEYSKGQSSRMVGEENEEGEMLDDALPKLNGRKRKGSPLDRGSEGKQRHDHASGYHRNSNNHDRVEDGHGMGPDGYTEKEHRKARSGESLVRH